MTYHLLEPEVAGGLGPETSWTTDPDGRSQLVEPLHYEFGGWLGDDIVTTSGYWVVTQRLADAITASGLTGCEFADVLVTRSPEYSSTESHFPSAWRRLLPVGTEEAGNDFVHDSGDLLINDAALAFLLDDFTIVNAYLSPEGESAQVQRFEDQVAKAREALAERARVQRELRNRQSNALAETLISWLADAPAEPEAPVMESSLKRPTSGDLTRAVAMIGKPLNDPICLGLIGLFEGGLSAKEVKVKGKTQQEYLAGDGALDVRVRDDVVRNVRFRSRDGHLPREAHFIEGVTEITRSSIAAVLGDPVRTMDLMKKAEFTGFDEHRFQGEPVACHYAGGQRTIVVVGAL